jgi:hypothetical protein
LIAALRDARFLVYLFGMPSSLRFVRLALKLLVTIFEAPLKSFLKGAAIIN